MPDYLVWMLQHLIAQPDSTGWRAGPPIGASGPRTGRATRYEAKALAAGRRSTYLSFRRRPRRS